MGAENLVFGVDQSHKARMLLGGTITQLKCHTKKEEHLKFCDIAVDWEIYDKQVDAVVYKTTTRYRKKYSRKNQMDSSDAHTLVLGALSSLLSRYSFVQVLKKKESVTNKGVNPAAEFRACDDPRRKLPDEMSEVLEATVVFVSSDNIIGSGFFFSSDGLIMTAAHVVAGLASVRVRQRDGTIRTASVVRRDEDHDVAILKTDGENHVCLPLDNTLPNPGAEIYAIGAPVEDQLAFSVSKGIVSGVREIKGKLLIQTDASVNPGNSGGPLVNMNGGVAGVVSSKLSGPGIEGLGFAVPASVSLARLNLIAGTKTTVAIASGGSGASFVEKTKRKPIVDPPDPMLPSPEQTWARIYREREERVEEARKKKQPVTRLRGWGVACMATSPVIIVGSLAGLYLQAEKKELAVVGTSVGGLNLVAGIAMAIGAKVIEKKRGRGEIGLVPPGSGSGLVLSYGSTF